MNDDEKDALADALGATEHVPVTEQLRRVMAERDRLRAVVEAVRRAQHYVSEGMSLVLTDPDRWRQEGSDAFAEVVRLLDELDVSGDTGGADDA